MSITAVPVEEITSGDQLFRCVPYSCTMLARRCVERQAQADSAFPPLSLLQCKGCALGAEVKRRAVGVSVDPLAAQRASRKHVRGVPHVGRLSGARKHSLPVIVSDATAQQFAVPPAADAVPRPLKPPNVKATEPPAPSAPEKETTVPELKDLTGKKIGGVTVLNRVENAPNTTWRVRHPTCGHEEDVRAISLAYCEKNNSKRRCPECANVEKEQPHASAAESTAARTPAPRRAPPPARPAEPSASSLTHEFPLRRDFTAKLELPTDLSVADVQRLARFLGVLVFEEG